MGTKQVYNSVYRLLVNYMYVVRCYMNVIDLLQMAGPSEGEHTRQGFRPCML